MDVSPKDKGIYAFGPFRLDPVRRTLQRDGTPIKLAARLFDTLVYLVQAEGRLVDKDELLAAVWGVRIVEEGNLTQTISSLRKALQGEGGEAGYIVTAPGRGYRFAAPVELRTGEAEPLMQSTAFEVAPAAPDSAPPPRARLWAWPAAATILALLGVMLWRSGRPPAAPPARAWAPPPHSVAVLAFANMTGDPARDYLSDGIADEVINALSRIDGLRVAARTSAFSFKGKSATIGDIARQLNVGAVLEGSMLRDGTRLRINAELVNAQTGFQFWARTYGGNSGTDGILQAQTDIATNAASSLQGKLLGGDSAKLTLGETRDAKAQDAYLRGMANAQALDDAHARQAIADYTQAVTVDPNYAAAYAARARVYNFMVTSGDGNDPGADKANLVAAISDADRAIALAPSLAAAHSVRAVVAITAWDFSGALREIGQARDLAPDNASILASYGQIHGLFGRVTDSLDALRRAVSLDPLNAAAFRRLATELYYTGRYDEALSIYHHADAIDSKMSRAKSGMEANVLIAKGDFAAAQRICAGGESYFDRSCLAIAYHGLGQQQLAEAQMTKLQGEMGDRAAAIYAGIYAYWGEPDQAIRWLQTAYRLRDSGLNELKVEHDFDAIRGLPAFQEIVRHMNFPG